MPLPEKTFIPEPVTKHSKMPSLEPPIAELRLDLSPKKSSMIDQNGQKYHLPPEFSKEPPEIFMIIETQQGLKIKLFNPLIKNLNQDLSDQVELSSCEMENNLDEPRDEYDNSQLSTEENLDEEQKGRSEEHYEVDKDNFTRSLSQSSTSKDGKCDNLRITLEKESVKNGKFLEQLVNNSGKFRFIYVFKIILSLY